MFLLTAAASSGRYRDTGPITTMHLILIGVLIVLAVLAIVWGARNKRTRAAAEQEEARRAEALLAHPPTQAEAALVPAPPEPAAAPAKPATKPRAPASSAAKAPRAKPSVKAASQPAAKVSPKPKVAPTSAAKAPKPTPAPTPASAYHLMDVKGLGPKAVPLLEGMGVRTLSDLAGLDTARAAEVDAGLGALSGRLMRDRWVEQAKLLAAGDVATFEATYGKL